MRVPEGDFERVFLTLALPLGYEPTHYFSGRSFLMEAVDAAALDASSALNR